MKKKKLLLILTLWLCCVVTPLLCASQALKRVAVTGYNIDNGLLQNTVASMVVDKFGFVWFSTASGVQRFDGTRFETVSFNEDSIAFHSAQLNILDNEEIWVSHSKGITAFNPETNRRRIILNKPPPRPNYFYKFVGEDANTAWYLSYPEAFLQFDKKSGRLVTSTAFSSVLNPLDRNFNCRPVANRYSIIQMGHSLGIFSLKEKRITFSYVTNEWITGAMPYNDHTILLTKGGKYYLLDTRSGKEKFIRQANTGEPESIGFSSWMNNEGLLIAAYEKNIYELDTATLAITSKWAAYNQDNLINSGGIYNMYPDRFGRLWIMTNSDGVKRLALNKQSFGYFGTAKKEVNFIRSIYVNKEKGIVLAGTFGNGLLVFDTSGYLLQQISNVSLHTITDIEYLGNDNYILLAMGSQTLHLFNRSKRTVSPLYIEGQKFSTPHCSYYGNLHRLADGSFIFTDQTVYRFRLDKNVITDTATIRGAVPWMYRFALLKQGGYCVASENGVEHTDNAFRRKSFLPFPQRVMVRCVAEDVKGFIWVGTERGLYKISPGNKFLKKYTVADGLADEIIYSIEVAEKGIYISHNKGLSFLSHEGKMIHYNRYSGLQENEFNSNASFKTSDGEIYFGGINGISSFYPNSLSPAHKLPPVYITSLHVMDKPWKDTAVWNIKSLEVDHDANRIALRVGIPASDGKNYVYQYRMEGLEPDWITTSGTDFIRYVLLPGSYTFRVRISNDIEGGISETSLRIVVAEPYWQTAWFKIAAATLLLVIIGLLIQRASRRKYLRKIKQLEMEHHLQTERERISRDLHDNLGAYASAIVDNVEKVSKNPNDDARLRSLKENAAEIMNNLRDTIWALNKKEISVLTLSDRIKAFLQKMREAFPSIKIILNEEVNANTSLSPELALNVLRIVQEALHNAIKHSGSNEIFITLNINEKLYICIRDTGIGVPQKINGGGNGFHNMRARAKENNVQLKIDSSDENGTSIELFSLLQ